MGRPFRRARASQAPWRFEPGPDPRQVRIIRLGLTYGLPGLGLALLLMGGFLLTARDRPPSGG